MPRIPLRDVPRSAPLAATTRSGRVECVHRGSVAVVSEDGRLLFAAGDPHRPIWLRSSAKPFQLAPFLAAGGERAFGLSTEEIALAAASHSGEAFHVAAAAAMLARGGFAEKDLHCGAHPPMHEPSAKALVLDGKEPTPLHNNCSGKHAAMLLACRHFECEPEGYWRRGHPLQKRILANVARMTGVPAAEIPLGVDGCSVPVFRVPLARLALAYARLVGSGPAGESSAERAARTRIADAMSEAPHMVAGTGRFTTEVVRASGGAWVAKEGAEGVYAVGVRRPKGGAVAIAVKVEDGAERGRDPAVVEALRAAGLAKGRVLAALRALAEKPVLNVRGDVVGEVVPLLRLSRARGRA